MEPRTSLGDRAVVIAGVLAVVVVALFGATPDGAGEQSAPTVRVVHR